MFVFFFSPLLSPNPVPPLNPNPTEETHFIFPKLPTETLLPRVRRPIHPDHASTGRPRSPSTLRSSLPSTPPSMGDSSERCDHPERFRAEPPNCRTTAPPLPPRPPFASSPNATPSTASSETSSSTEAPPTIHRSRPKPNAVATRRFLLKPLDWTRTGQISRPLFRLAASPPVLITQASRSPVPPLQSATQAARAASHGVAPCDPPSASPPSAPPLLADSHPILAPPRHRSDQIRLSRASPSRPYTSGLIRASPPLAATFH